MKKCTISVQSGLNELADLLKKEGYNVCDMGYCNIDTDITIVNVSDYRYEGLNSNDCRICKGDKKSLVINSANYSNEEVLQLIKNNTCCECC